MNEKPTPTDVLQKMLAVAAKCDTIDQLPLPGTYAKEYGDTIKGDLDADNVEAFLNGSAVVNLLIQEAILRVTTVAQNTEVEDESVEEAFALGVNEGALLVARIMGTVIDGLIGSLIEEPAVDRAFNGIVANF